MKKNSLFLNVYEKRDCRFYEENIALSKTAWLQYPYVNQQWGADKAVDGRFTDRSPAGGQCTISGNVKTTATLWVDLGGLRSIHHVNFFYRTDNIIWGSSNPYTSRVLGFSVYISNTTKKDEWFLCFKDTNYTRDTVPENVTLDCVKHGRYVIYYNERLPGVIYPEGYSAYAFSELCELQVYVCPTAGYYGENCTITCPQNCKKGHCNIEDGTCLRCVPGYKEPRCEEECDNTRYGPECNMTCGNCSNVQQCNHVNGSCPNGCDVGVQGNKCDQECPQGRHGKNCVELCNPNCKGVCNRFTGVCEFGCNDGWKGVFCENECDGRTYGEDCGVSCGSCLNIEQCQHVNGTCFKGCDRGFQGERCTSECLIGRYGYNCQDVCSINCGIPSRCNRVTGECQGGCQAGWKGMKCDQKCDIGSFGQNCAQSCGVCLHKEQCHHINGTCLNGCHRGYQGDACTRECAWGFYGYNCNETCSSVFFNNTCNAMTGACPLVSAPDPPETNTAPITGIVVAVIVVILAVGILFFVFRRKRTSSTSKEQNHLERRGEHLSVGNTTPNKDIHEKIKENGLNQALGPRTKISDNGEYQELGPKTEISDNGGYQELAPRKEVSDNGDYQELGPRIDTYAKSNDNTGYLEIGQIGQTSPYEN
ncbi:multiple epidermal growth factor-like domains protein 10 [Saccostrea cucullata]|uniref:multiple epidermal growth factor-like domains protein 10 n=1 Tax=Saccostrea cuccullata TaxID=36930 RepID=UPI002ED0423A